MNGSVGDPTSRLSAAILRISQSLDLATVLEEAVESARALTGARVGVMTTFDERGRVGMEWPDGPRLFEHLRDLPAPLRMADVPGYLGSLGLSVSPWGSRTLQGTPMHHRGEHLGNFFLGDREDGEAFTAEDEEILVLFASQAATAIANARTHRDVERARADLEALVETSPVGVVVFDSGTGRAVSEDGTLVPVFERPRAEASERCCLITTAAFSAAARGADVPRMDPERRRGPGPASHSAPSRAIRDPASPPLQPTGAQGAFEEHGRLPLSNKGWGERGPCRRSLDEPCRLPRTTVEGGFIPAFSPSGPRRPS